jgi:hypothetical protein
MARPSIAYGEPGQAPEADTGKSATLLSHQAQVTGTTGQDPGQLPRIRLKVKLARAYPPDTRHVLGPSQPDNHP